MTAESVTAKLRDGPWSQTTIETEGHGLYLGVELQAHPGLIADVMVFWRSERHQQKEIGYVFHPAYRGRGFATEAARAAVDLAFTGLELHRLVAIIDPRNTASIRVAERLAMRQEGHLQENKYLDGEWRSEQVFSMLRSEWENLPL